MSKPILILSTIGNRKSVIDVKSDTEWNIIKQRVAEEVGVDISSMQITALSRKNMSEFMITDRTVISNDEVAILSLSPTNVKNRMNEYDPYSRKSMTKFIRANTTANQEFIKLKELSKRELYIVCKNLENKRPEAQLFQEMRDIIDRFNRNSNVNRNDAVEKLSTQVKELFSRVMDVEIELGIVNNNTRDSIIDNIEDKYPDFVDKFNEQLNAYLDKVLEDDDEGSMSSDY